MFSMYINVNIKTAENIVNIDIKCMSALLKAKLAMMSESFQSSPPAPVSRHDYICGQSHQGHKHSTAVLPCPKDF